jgi:hypothetical protein
MDPSELMQSIDRIEACADKAKYAVHASHAPGAVRIYVESLHQLARQAKESVARQPEEGALRDLVVQLEQVADRALEACRNAGNQVDAQTQQAVQRAHDEASRLMQQMQAGSPV